MRFRDRIILVGWRIHVGESLGFGSSVFRTCIEGRPRRGAFTSIIAGIHLAGWFVLHRSRRIVFMHRRPPPTKAPTSNSAAPWSSRQPFTKSATETASLSRKARLTQLCDLTLLPVGEQERLLFLESVDGLEPVTERGLRLAETLYD